jgi:hypothetical protein
LAEPVFSSGVKFTKVYSDGISEYKGQSMGIPAKEFGDLVYFCTYIEVDGEAYYGTMTTYSVQEYCVGRISKKTVGEKLKALCATMLNYGTAAQMDFDYKETEPSNAVLAEQVELGNLDAKYLVQNWDASLLVAAQTPTAEMTVNFAQNDAKLTAKSLLLEGAITMKFTVGYKIDYTITTQGYATQLPEGATITYYFWNEATYNALLSSNTALTKENASYTRSSTVEEEVVANKVSAKYGYEYYALADSLAAKEMTKTTYVAAVVTEADGTEYCTGVEAYSPVQYAINQLNKETAKDTLKDLCRWMVLYGDTAKTYFAK